MYKIEAGGGGGGGVQNVLSVTKPPNSPEKVKNQNQLDNKHTS